MADISIGYAIMLARFAGLGDELPETLRAYFDRLAERPAFRAAKAAQKLAWDEKKVARAPPAGTTS
jgi:glutathione S-transferase